MSNSINDILVNVVDASQLGQGVNFGAPLLVGFTGSRGVVRLGSGNAGFVVKSKTRRLSFSVDVQIAAAYNYSYSSSLLTIEAPATARVRDLIADFYASAPAAILAEFDIQAVGTGAGLVVDYSVTASTLIDYLRVENISQLLYYYDETDLEYVVVRNILASNPSPNVVYVLDLHGVAVSSIGSQIASRDNGDWFCVLTTAYTASDLPRIEKIAEYVDSTDRIALFTYASDTILDDVKSPKIAFLIHDNPSHHPEASWAAKCLPAVPTAGWKWQSSLQGQIANTTSTLSDIIAVRNKNGNSYVRRAGIDYVDGSQCNPVSGKVYLDQSIGRLWIKINLQLDLFNLFLRTANEGRRIPYTDAGIETIKSTIANRLFFAGELGIIAPVETAEQAKLSYDGIYRYRVTSLTRAEIENLYPADIAARVLRGVKYSFVETGAIEKVEITGVVLLSE